MSTRDRDSHEIASSATNNVVTHAMSLEIQSARSSSLTGAAILRSMYAATFSLTNICSAVRLETMRACASMGMSAHFIFSRLKSDLFKLFTRVFTSHNVRFL